MRAVGEHERVHGVVLDIKHVAIAKYEHITRYSFRVLQSMVDYGLWVGWERRGLSTVSEINRLDVFEVHHCEVA